MTEALLQIEDVNVALPDPRLWGSFKVIGVGGSQVELIGWTLGAAAEVERVEVLSGGTVVATTTPSLPRNELAERWPDRPSAASCGFRVVIEANGKGRSLLRLQAVLEDQTTVPMGEITVQAKARRWDVFRRR